MITTPVGHKISIMQPLDVVKPRNACSWSNWGLTISLQWPFILQVRLIVQFCAPPPGGCTMAILYIAPGGTKFKLHVECQCFGCYSLQHDGGGATSQPANQPTNPPANPSNFVPPARWAMRINGPRPCFKYKLCKC